MKRNYLILEITQTRSEDVFDVVPHRFVNSKYTSPICIHIAYFTSEFHNRVNLIIQKLTSKEQLF